MADQPIRSASRTALMWLRDVQYRFCERCDRLLPRRFRVDGNREFQTNVFPDHLREGQIVYDVGGGKNPIISLERKLRYGLEVIGIDIDADELAQAPPGVYDRTVVAGIEHVTGRGEADLVVLQTVFEHVRDSDAAMASVRSLLRPGGRLLFFVPSRNAAFARLNLLLPESLKRRLLRSVYPETGEDQGFPARYDACTPREMKALARRHGFDVVEERYYFKSSYFYFFAPLYLVWRAWLLCASALIGSRAAETFTFVLVKRPLPDDPPPRHVRRTRREPRAASARPVETAAVR